MSKYNKPVEKAVGQTTTHEGGIGFTQSDEATLIGILSTGLSNTYYEKENDRDKRFAEVFNKVASKDKNFAAKSLIYARTKFGQRTVTHRGAVELIPHLVGDPLGKRFFSKRDRKSNNGGVVYRLDDMTEILACYLAKNGQNASIPNSIKKGFKDAIENADAYQLAKYQMKNKAVSLVDIVNLVHPKETEIQGIIEVQEVDYLKATSGTKFVGQSYEVIDGMVKVPALRALILGILKQFNTVEDKNTDSGKKTAEAVKAGEISKEEAEVVLNESKIDNYKELIESKKIGYLALLRNIRNILKTNDINLLDKACELLIEPNFIRKSLVWPVQIDLALEIMLIEFSGRNLQKVLQALATAYERSIPNLEKLLPEGKTAVVFDTSGSMSGSYRGLQIDKNRSIQSSPLEKAALVAATFAKGTGGDVYHFGVRCARISGFNPNDAINTLKLRFKGEAGNCGHGTYYQSILPELEKSGGQYDRILIITDEQGADSFESSYKSYSHKYGKPYVYFINICGYGPTMAKSNNKVFRLFGYTQDIYEKIPQLEINPNVVIDEIKKINI